MDITEPIKKLLSPSVRYRLSESAGRVREQLRISKILKWENSRIAFDAAHKYSVSYWGGGDRKDFVRALLNFPEAEKENLQIDDKEAALVSEFPLMGSIRVPGMLSSVIPLHRPVEDIVENYHGQLRRELLRNRKRYHLERITDEGEIESCYQEMLVPYANARHGQSAHQISYSEVKRMALDYGRMDKLILDGEVIGCQISHAIEQGGKRYWSTNRCGYLEKVFSDQKYFREANSINIFLAMEWANDNGYDFYDIGVSMARPGDGLLEWKRRRGSILSLMGNSIFFHVRLPRTARSDFLWASPIFGVRGKKLDLHLGLPTGKAVDEVVSRYREMAFGGLNRVILHSEMPPSPELIESIATLFETQNVKPTIETRQTA